MQHTNNDPRDIELLIARRASAAAEERLLAEMEQNYSRRSLVAAVRHYAVALVVAAVLSAGVLACTSVPDGRDMSGAGDRTVAIDEINYVIENL